MSHLCTCSVTLLTQVQPLMRIAATSTETCHPLLLHSGSELQLITLLLDLLCCTLASDAYSEKHTRSKLKSAVERLISKKGVLILDSMNSIKVPLLERHSYACSM